MDVGRGTLTVLSCLGLPYLPHLTFLTSKTLGNSHDPSVCSLLTRGKQTNKQASQQPSHIRRFEIRLILLSALSVNSPLPRNMRNGFSLEALFSLQMFCTVVLLSTGFFPVFACFLFAPVPASFQLQLSLVKSRTSRPPSRCYSYLEPTNNQHKTTLDFLFFSNNRVAGQQLQQVNLALHLHSRAAIVTSEQYNCQVYPTWALSGPWSYEYRGLEIAIHHHSLVSAASSSNLVATLLPHLTCSWDFPLGNLLGGFSFFPLPTRHPKLNFGGVMGETVATWSSGS